jgi:hypothetical protein
MLKQVMGTQTSMVPTSLLPTRAGPPEAVIVRFFSMERDSGYEPLWRINVLPAEAFVSASVREL